MRTAEHWYDTAAQMAKVLFSPDSGIINDEHVQKAQALRLIKSIQLDAYNSGRYEGMTDAAEIAARSNLSDDVDEQFCAQHAASVILAARDNLSSNQPTTKKEQ